MPPNEPVILAINPGTKYLAVAVFKGSQLKDWRIKTLRGRWSAEKMHKAMTIITDLIDLFQPDSLCLKRVNPSRSSTALDSLIEEITKLAFAKNLWLYRYPIKVLEACLCGEKKRNKSGLSEAIAARFPDLYRELEIENSRKNPYYTRLFEAVALGAVCIQNQQEI